MKISVCNARCSISSSFCTLFRPLASCLPASLFSFMCSLLFVADPIGATVLCNKSARYTKKETGEKKERLSLTWFIASSYSTKHASTSLTPRFTAPSLSAMFHRGLVSLRSLCVVFHHYLVILILCAALCLNLLRAK